MLSKGEEEDDKMKAKFIKQNMQNNKKNKKKKFVSKEIVSIY